MSHFFCPFYSQDSNSTFYSVLLRKSVDADFDLLAERSAGITSRLFIAAILSQYGSIVSRKIRETVEELKGCDQRLESTKRISYDRYEEITNSIHFMNEKLISMTQNLSGTRSTMHYLAESANILVDGITTFEDYVTARFKDWGEHCSKERLDSLTQAFRKLDGCKEKIRDNDKLVMLREKMWQHKTDVKSLQQHIDINVGMVSYSTSCFAIINEHHPNIYFFAGT